MYVKKFKIYHIIFILIALFNLLVSASKGPLLGLIAVIFLITVAKVRKINMRVIVVYTIILSVIWIIFIAGILNDFFLFQRIVNREDDTSTSDRILSINNAVLQIQENLISGSHYFVTADKSSPHNIFIDIILSTGVLGLLLFTYPLFQFLRIIFINFLRNPIIPIAFLLFCLAQTSGYVYGLLDLGP